MQLFFVVACIFIVFKPDITAQLQIKISITLIILHNVINAHVNVDSSDGYIGLFPTRVTQTFPITPEH